MHLSDWFKQQLQASAQGLLWATELIPQERLYVAPRPDRWPVARLVYHVVCYEQRLALPSMHQWLGGPKPEVGTLEEDQVVENRLWNDGQGHDIAQLLADFRTVRAAQLALLDQFSAQCWQEERDALWGGRSLQWVVTKTYQHTLEHTDEILRHYLWWQ